MPQDRYPSTEEEAQTWCRKAETRELIAAEQAEKEAERKLPGHSPETGKSQGENSTKTQ